METIEIRQNKKILIPMLVLFSLALIGMVFTLFFTEKFSGNWSMKVLLALGIFFLAYVIYIPSMKFIKNEPVLIIDSSRITFNKTGKSVSFLWTEITDWKIVKEGDGGTNYLIIITPHKKKKINISWLEKKPHEIEKLIQHCSTR